MTIEYKGYDEAAEIKDADIAEAFAVYRRSHGDVTVKLVPGRAPNSEFVAVYGLSVADVAEAIGAYQRASAKSSKAVVADPPIACPDLATMPARDQAVQGSAMTLAEFQDGCRSTATYPGEGNCSAYPLLGLIGEVGELTTVALRAARLSMPFGVSYIHIDVMEAMMNVGRLAETLKKAYRNNGGVLDTDARYQIVVAIEAAYGALNLVSGAVDNWNLLDRVELPPFTFSEVESQSFIREAGDVGWYWAVVLSEFRLRLENVCRALLDKLRARAERGTLHSTGDDESARPPAHT
jgi:hypothetical protein